RTTWKGTSALSSPGLASCPSAASPQRAFARSITFFGAMTRSARAVSEVLHSAASARKFLLARPTALHFYLGDGAQLRGKTRRHNRGIPRNCGQRNPGFPIRGIPDFLVPV